MPSTKVKVMSQWRSGGLDTKGSGTAQRQRAELGDPDFTVNDDTLVLVQRFRLVPTTEGP